jgi:hypothetical protein
VNLNYDEDDDPMVNIAKGLHRIANAVDRVAESICPFVSAGGQDAQGGHVQCLTEAVMGVTSALTSLTDLRDLTVSVPDPVKVFIEEDGPAFTKP